MEKLTKRILAIVIIIIVGAGIGVGAWFFLIAPPAESRYETPGVTGVKSDHMIKIGLLGGITEIQGKGNYEGAWLAAYNINKAGGITVDNETYYIGIVTEDTDESNPVLDVTKGVSAAKKILDVDKAEYIVGGFRTESLKAYYEVVMDAKKLFIGTGASTDYFCENVLESPSRYKYWFRVMPINSTSLGLETITFLYILKLYLTAALSKPITKVAIIREALDWTVPMDEALHEHLPDFGYEIVTDIAYPITAGSEQFATYWNQIEALDAQITIPIISAQGGIYMMTQYADLHPQCFVAGIDVQSQLDTQWAATDGGCAYETIMQPMVRTNKTDLTIAFWDDFLAKWDHEPLYTAIGAYDAVNLIADAIESTQAFDANTLITFIEGYTKASPGVDLSVSAKYTAFTRGHDVVEGWPYGVTLFAQWKSDGTKDCVTTFNAIYPDSIVTGPIVIPPWGIND
jgi:branched-chain amino acid transport system substrate-binding protein